MTLSEICRTFFVIAKTPKVHIFTNADALRHWILHDTDADPVFTIKSYYRVDSFLYKHWCEAEVLKFYAVKRDVIAILVKEGATHDT
jgi:hypothetical protein